MSVGLVNEWDGKTQMPMYESSEDRVNRILAESEQFRKGLHPDPIVVGKSLQEEEAANALQQAEQALMSAVRNLSKFRKAEGILYLVRQAIGE